ncbi:zinc finger MYND domain-containing protein [Aspergillus mulundensis]|uniref:MYND-type domain-containing protein n=1 Tax=Aspergillus mulundensis TaxID=1810919 RepID=A0A3D8RE99_9EURO|nr:hypothetical protein DSM5745_07541 [Aspergillus mulundensis]RDW72369.1 hypothetical protein DSM5745_07541 [Aspergillus mulundensis]
MKKDQTQWVSEEWGIASRGGDGLDSSPRGDLLAPAAGPMVCTCITNYQPFTTPFASMTDHHSTIYGTSWSTRPGISGYPSNLPAFPLSIQRPDMSVKTMRFRKVQTSEAVKVAATIQACTKCEKRGTTAPPFKRCAKCSMAWYCSRHCQTADWKTHKKVCGRNSAERLNPFIRPRNLLAVIENPYHKLQSKTWLHDRPYDDVYKLLIDTYRLRMYNQWALQGHADEDSIYASGVSDGYAGFSRFLRLVERRYGLLPDDWSYSDVVDCVNYGLRNEWSDLNGKVNETSIFAYYGSQSVVAELKIFAWQIYGWDVTGSLTPHTLKALVEAEGRGSFR